MTCLFLVGFPGQVWMAPVLLTDKRHSLEKCCFQDYVFFCAYIPVYFRPETVFV
jgi:hypothetical protein